MTANEIQNLADGIPITRLDGVLKETYKPKNGEKNGKPWEVQDAVLQLPDGEVKLKAWNCGDLKDLKGQQIVIEAHKSDRHGWVGVKKVVEEYPKASGKIYHKVEINEQCKVYAANGSQPACPPGTQITANATTIEYDEDAAVRDARAFAMKMANALLIALEASRYVAGEFEKKHLGESLSGEQQQAMCSSIFISMDKQGVGNKLPSHPLKPLVRESVLPKREEAPKANDEEIPW